LKLGPEDLKRGERLSRPRVAAQEPKSGANPSIVSYNANVAKIHNAIYSLVRFENKNIFFYYGETL
jgi:hypothetical protein